MGNQRDAIYVPGPQGFAATPQSLRGRVTGNPGLPTGMMLRRGVPEVQQEDEYVCRVSTWLKNAINTRRAEAIKSYRRALYSRLLQLEDAATRAAQARRWDLSLVDVLMQDVDGSTVDLFREADRMVQELAGED
jgi:hypothetical protein